MRKVLIKEYGGRRFAISEGDIIAVRVVDIDTYDKRVNERRNFYSYLSHDNMYNTYKERYGDKWIVARVSWITRDGDVRTSRIDYCRPTQSNWTYANPLGNACRGLNDIHFDIIKIKGSDGIHSAKEYGQAISNASAKEFGVNDNDICTNDPDNKRKDISNLKETEILRKVEGGRRIRAQVEAMKDVVNNELTSTPTVN